MNVRIAAALALLMVSEITAMGQSVRPNWECVSEKADWCARDSQGELVFDDQIWILGGWVDSYQSPLRDVWSTADGKKWLRVTQNAPWKAADLPMTVAFENRMWLMGGWYNGRLPDRAASNEVWCSADGKEWKQVTARADWSAAQPLGSCLFAEKCGS